MVRETDEVFEIVLTSLDASCVITTSPVPVYIIDNDGKHPLLWYLTVNGHVLGTLIHNYMHVFAIS